MTDMTESQAAAAGQRLGELEQELHEREREVRALRRELVQARHERHSRFQHYLQRLVATYAPPQSGWLLFLRWADGKPTLTGAALWHPRDNEDDPPAGDIVISIPEPDGLPDWDGP